MAHIIEIWRCKYLSGRYLLNRWIVYNKTKYGHKSEYQTKKRKKERKKKVASFGARPYQTVLTVIFRLAAAFATNLSLVVHRHRSCENIELLQFSFQGLAKENHYRLIFVQMVESLVTKVGMVMHHHEPTCHAKRFAPLSSRSKWQLGFIESAKSCLLNLLNCWSFCLQIYFDDLQLHTSVSCKKTGLLLKVRANV